MHAKHLAQCLTYGFYSVDAILTQPIHGQPLIMNILLKVPCIYEEYKVIMKIL